MVHGHGPGSILKRKEQNTVLGVRVLLLLPATMLTDLEMLPLLLNVSQLIKNSTCQGAF